MPAPDITTLQTNLSSRFPNMKAVSTISPTPDLKGVDKK
jgi:hypothetical protein